MNAERLLSSINLRQRAVGVFLLLAVFFLPLHYHPANATTSQINHQCSCLHGARTQIAVNTTTPQWLSPLLVFPHESFEPQLASRAIAGFQSIRAPPVF
jgi:hypothetical protein